jgi:hypothetical protein
MSTGALLHANRGVGLNIPLRLPHKEHAMNLHRLFVPLMLAWTLVYALLYISTFLAAGEAGPGAGLPAQQAGPDKATPVSDTGKDGAVKRGSGAESPRHFA